MGHLVSLDNRGAGLSAELVGGWEEKRLGWQDRWNRADGDPK